MTQPRPRRDIALVLAVKLIALIALYLLFFGPSHQPAADPASMFGVARGATSGEHGR